MHYIFTPLEEGQELKFSPTDFLREYSLKWSDVTIPDKPFVKTSNLTHYWYRHIEDRDVEGFILLNGLGVSLIVEDISDAIEFAFWFRSFIPDSLGIMMCDEQCSNFINLTKFVTEDEIRATFSNFDQKID